MLQVKNGSEKKDIRVFFWALSCTKHHARQGIGKVELLMLTRLAVDRAVKILKFRTVRVMSCMRCLHETGLKIMSLS